MTWTRQRLPDDVPTPVAVAVADFCRRAEAPASPALVREALSCVADADDFRVKALADAEPAAKPLGPFAVVDVVNGIEPALAAEREVTGYYELARTLARASVTAAPLTAPSAPRPAARPSAPRAERAEKRTRKKKEAPSLAERIAPRRREPAPPAEAPVARPPASSFLPRHDLPAPRGRFARLDPPKAPFDTLLRPAARDELLALVDQVGHRVALLQAIERSYSGSRGPLTVADVENALTRHRLAARVVEKERSSVLGALTEARGSRGRAAHALGVSAPQFEYLVEAAGIVREEEELKERFVREALSPKSLAVRLDLLGRTRYLEDLGIESRFRQALANDLEALLDEHTDDAEDDAALIALVAAKEGLNAELLGRAVEKLGLISPEEDS